MKEIIKIIRAKRAYHNMSGRELSEKIGLGYGSYRMFETGKCGMGYDKFILLMYYLGLSFNDVFNALETDYYNTKTPPQAE